MFSCSFSPLMFITVLWFTVLWSREGNCRHVTSEKTWRLRKVLSWPRSHSLIKDGTGTYSSTISSPSFSETEGGDQFDLSSLDVRTMFLFLKEYFKLFNSDLPLRQVLYSSANELWPPVNQIYLSLFSPLYSWFWKLSQSQPPAVCVAWCMYVLLGKTISTGVGS